MRHRPLWLLGILCSATLAGAQPPDLTPTVRALEEAVAQQDVDALNQVIAFDNEQAAVALGVFFREFKPRFRCEEISAAEESELAYSLYAQCRITTQVLGRTLERGPVPIQWGVVQDPTAKHGYRIVEHELLELLLPMDLAFMSRIARTILFICVALLLLAGLAFILALRDPRLESRRGPWLTALVILAPLSSVVYLGWRVVRRPPALMGAMLLGAAAAGMAGCAHAPPAPPSEEASIDRLQPKDVVSVVPPTEWGTDRPAPGDRALVYDQKDGQPIAWVEFREERSEDGRANGHATLFNQSTVITPDDRLRLTDFSRKVAKFPGQANFLFNGRRTYSSRYKHLAWFGSFVGEGLPLDYQEFMIDAFGHVGYGIAPRLTLQSWVLLGALGSPNLSLRALLVDENWLKLTGGFQELYDVWSGQLSSQFRFLLLFPGGSKFNSYTVLSLSWTNQITTPAQPTLRTDRIIVSTNLQSIYEYIFDNWDRIQAGPVYDLKKQALGGFMQYLFVWDRFHLILGLRTGNFLDFRIDFADGYLPYFSVYWRI